MKTLDDYDFSKFDYNKKYHLHVDFDTPIFSCAATVSKDECIATLKTTGKSRVFENFDTFVDFLNTSELGKKYTIKDFNVNVVGFAIHNLNNKLDDIIDHDWVSDYTLYVGGKNNFRKDIYPEYKGNRAKSPAMRSVLFGYVVNRYKDKVVVSDGDEAEDECLSTVLSDIENNVCGYCDKDLTTQSAFFLNYQKMSRGVFFIDKTQAFYNLCCQILHGDKTDHIFGITHISKELKDKYGIKTKSIGARTAEKLLEDVQHDKILMKERVIEVYKLSFGDSWKDRLQFTGSLVFISKNKGEYFDIDKFTKGVQYETT